MRSDFEDRIVLVTGGVRGLGRAISKAFAARGAHVIVNYFHSSAEAPALIAELNAIGSAEAIRGSVANKAQADAMFDQIRDRHGRLDVLVNNAASGALLPLSELDETHWQRAWDTNLRGSLWCSRRAADLMDGQGGAIVNLSSLGSSLVISDYATVGTSKAAVEALTRYLAVEFAGRNIRVNTASGGLLDGAVAGMFPGSDGLVRRVREATPLQHRLGREEELAELVLFLASPAASWITGQTVVADGGLSLGSLSLSPAPAEQSPVVDANAMTTPVERAPAMTTPRSDPRAIAVVGMGVVTPGANDPDELWQVLSRERHVFCEPTRFDVTSFYSAEPDVEDRTYTRNSGFITDFRPHPRLQEEIERGTVPSRESTTLWLRHSLYSALEGVIRRDDDRFLTAIGYTADGSQDLEEYLVLSGYLARLGENGEQAEVLRKRYRRLGDAPYEYLPHRVGHNAIAGILPAETELVMVDTACSSSLYAVDLGIKALQEGACEIAVCGGAFEYTARNLVLFSKLHGLSRSGEVRSFDRAADGVLFSDGAGLVVLKRLDRARADSDRVLGVINGVGLSCDGGGKAIYAPNPDGQVIALRRAYERSGVNPASLDWVVAHATGTRAGDSTEVASLHRMAGDGLPALLSSNKAIVGHTGWTAGLVSLVQALSGLGHNAVPPQRYLREPIEALEGSRFTPPTAIAPLPAGKSRNVGVSSFGFGGTNAHLVLGEDGSPERPEPEPSTEDIVIVGWSADLPGLAGADDVTAWLRGEGAAPETNFGEQYPLPSFAEVRLPPATLRNMDRTQIMLLRAAAQLSDVVREACSALRDSTGVVVGHMGPTRRAVHYALRCYLGDLRTCLDDEAGLDAIADEVRGLVPPSTEDAFPGIMPNIIPARLAALSDYHGLNVTIDTGPDAGLDAIRCAERYLRHGDLEIAVVAGINGNSTPELAEVLASADRHDQIAEGAFVVVLTRESTARARNLEVLARVNTTLGAADSSSRPAHLAPLARSGCSFLGADPMVAMLAYLVAGRSGRVSSDSTWGPQLQITVANSALPVKRMVRRLMPAPAVAVRDALPAVPEGALVLVTDDVRPERLPLPASARVVHSPRWHGGDLPEPDELESMLPIGEFTHIRVLANVGASESEPDDLSVAGRLRILHDLAYLGAARWRVGEDSSYAVLLTDAVRQGVPHPATGMFTGLVKSLARETSSHGDGGRCFAVLTDEADYERGLTLLAAESRCRHALFVAVHNAATRSEYVLHDAPAPPAKELAPALDRDSVVVAAGGSRGLTAEILVELARQHAPTVYVLGRQKPSDEGSDCAKADFIARERHRTPRRTVTELSAEYDRQNQRALAGQTIRRLVEHCGPGRVHHLMCDLTDPDAVRAAVDRIHAERGRVDLLVNAAGLHHGGTVRSTPLAAMRRVRDTKLLAYMNLQSAFAERPPRRWYSFGSLLAVLGWPGEVDYCSGNDVVQAAASWQRRHLGRDETTMAWPLWNESGFAAEPVVRDLLRSQAALTGVSNAQGVALFLDELRGGGPDADIVFLGAAERGLLNIEGGDFEWSPDPVRDGYLDHHLLGGIPSMPGALIAELAVRAAGPGSVAVLRDVRFHAPVAAMPNKATTYRIRRDATVVHVLSDVVAPNGTVLRKDRLHAEVGVEFSPIPHGVVRVPIPRPEGPVLTPGYYVPGSRVELSGPFASLVDVRVATGTGSARFAPQLGTWREVFAGFCIPALLLDALFQFIVLTRCGAGPILVPAGVERVELFTEHNDVELLDRYGSEIVLATESATGASVALTPEGVVLMRVSGLLSNSPSPTTQTAASDLITA
ncbi:SDR family oxidoreductase [Pseudonocardia sp. H11422]|uniref:SDR family oxidoreductase n=1 Tax=Pseudonocardia sp. H11422 TaxID=2835866 RepID=UPI001BDBC718|nr:SDR family oxidoreductase [Pseudonocardia sp. H11422]